MMTTIILKCSSVIPLGFSAKQESGMRYREDSICTKSVDIRKRGDSIRMNVTSNTLHLVVMHSYQIIASLHL